MKRLTTALCAAALLSGCHDVPVQPEPSPPVSKIYGILVGIGAPNPGFIVPGMVMNMYAQANDSLRVIVPVSSWTWRSLDTAIATVDAAGHLTARRVGYARIEAEAEGHTGMLDVRVADPASIYMLEPDSSQMLPGQRRTILVDAGAAETQWGAQRMKAMHGGWRSSNPAVVTVDSDGVVTAIAPGQATVSIDLLVTNTTFSAIVAVAAVPPNLRFTQLAVGAATSCALTATGEVYCWGGRGAESLPKLNLLGTTAQADRCFNYSDFISQFSSTRMRSIASCAMEPIRVQLPAPLVSISAQGMTTCGLTADGLSYCWGQTGAFTADGLPTALPVLVSSTLRFSSFTAPCGVTLTHEAWCWGPGTMRGTADTVATPSLVDGGAVWRSITAEGQGFRCGIRVDSTVACWGTNSRGELGSGDLTSSTVPRTIADTQVVSTVIANFHSACALTVAGVIECWGNGSKAPTPVNASVSFVSLSGDPNFLICGLAADGTPYCGGSLRPEPVGDLRFTALAASNPFSYRCGIARDALLYCWGMNSAGQLGIGDNQVQPSTPTRVIGQ